MVYLIAEDCGNKPGNAGHSLDITEILMGQFMTDPQKE